MCGRYVLKNPKQASEALARLGVKAADSPPLPLHYNVAPAQTMPVIRGGEEWALADLRWGHLVQFGPAAKPTLLINGRSEMAAEKRTFKKAVQDRRCIVPADGFFEWKQNPNIKFKLPYYFRVKGEPTFWIAGLHWPEDGDEPANYILLTTAPNELLAPIHDRMPVILDDAAAKAWLATGALKPGDMARLCASYPAGDMVADAVGTMVNNARNDAPECIALAER